MHFSGDNSYSLFQPPIFVKQIARIVNPPKVSTLNCIMSVLTTADKPPKNVYNAEKIPKKIINTPIL